MYRVADGSGRDSYVVYGSSSGRYERPRLMTPVQTAGGVCPRNRPRDMTSAHDWDIISNRKADELVSPKRFRPQVFFTEPTVDHSPPKVLVPLRQPREVDRRLAVQTPATPPRRLQTTKQTYDDAAFRGRTPLPAMKEAGHIAGFGGHRRGQVR